MNNKFDLERARQETPGCRTVTHLNNAGASLMPQPVVDATITYLQTEAKGGGYETADAYAEELNGFYTSAARFIGAKPNEIAFVENATRAWDMAFYSIPFSAGDRILTSQAEYASNYIAFLQMVQRSGVTVEAVPNDASGQLSTDALQNMVDDRVKLIAISHIPTNGGLVQPAAEIGRIAREANIIYLLDACQSVGQIPVDVAELGCDMLSTTGRKYLRGPRGTGFLYVTERMITELEPVFLDLHAASWTSRDSYTIRDDAKRFENWETNFAGKVGLKAALEYAEGWGIETTAARLIELAATLRAKLATIPGIVVRDLGEKQGGIVTFTVPAGFSVNEIKQFMKQQAINVSTSTVFSTRLEMESRQVGEMVRASLHYYNTEEEVDRFCTLLERQIGAAR